MTESIALWSVVGAAILMLVIAGVSLLLMALGLAPEGSRRRKWARRFVDAADAAFVALGVGGAVLLSRRKRDLGPARDQIRATRKERAAWRQVQADMSATLRAEHAASEGRVTAILVGARNSVDVIHREIDAMPTEGLIEEWNVQRGRK